MRSLVLVLLASWASSVAFSQGNCTFSISPGGQAFGTAGGSGSVTVATNPGCAWTASNTLPWVFFPGSASGIGSGTLVYSVAVNPGDFRSGTMTVAGNSFAVEQASAFANVFTSSGTVAQVAFAGGWTTTFTLVNLGTTPAQARLNFFDNNGNPLSTPLVFPQTTGTSGPLSASTLDRGVAPGAAVVIQTAGSQSATTQTGWAQIQTSGNMTGFAVFQQAIGASIQEALVPLESRTPPAFYVWFDNTAGYATGIGLVNTSTQNTNVPIIIHDDTGALLLSTTVGVPAQGHTSFNLATNYSVAANKRGTLEVDAPNGAVISVLGLRFNPTGAFTTIPVLVK